MVKRFLTTAVALIAAAGISFGAQIATFTGPQDPSQLNASLNTLVASINSSVGALGAGTVAASTTATTVESTLQSYTLPPGALSAAGQAIRASCWGTTGANANNKTMKLYFGSSVVTTPTAATNNGTWLLRMVVLRKTATTQGFMGDGLVNTTAVAPSVTDGAETLANGILIKCTGTNGTASASDITANGLLVEGIR